MADDLNQPYIGYRSAGRRRPELNDRAASANAPLAALRGLASGVLGAPGDIESLVRMLPGLSEQTFLPTSEDIERRLPLRSVSETPVGRAATGAGQIGGGFYTGPGSPLRAIAGLPSAVSRAGRDFAMAAGQPATPMIVWHGSPHKFDKFDASKIGTGEGAQAYGHGLYLAESPDVARTYQTLDPTVLAPPVRTFRGVELDPGTPQYHAATLAEELGLAKARKMVEGWLKNPDPRMTKEAEGWRQSLDLLNQAEKKSDFKQLKNKGSLYTVDLPDSMIASMLDWDKPLREQSTELQELARKFGAVGPDGDVGSVIGKGLHEVLGDGSASRKTAEQLRSIGIPGIRYLDAGSRGVGQGTSNFVIFPGEESMLRILERNGEPLDELIKKYVTVDEIAPQSEALRLAQQRAALPVEKGGLGLPANNTAADRAAAMGFDTPAYHGTTVPFEKFNTNTRGTYFTSPDAGFANKYTVDSTGQIIDDANVIPVLVNPENAFDYQNKLDLKNLSQRASLGALAESQIKKGDWRRLEDRTTLEAIKKIGKGGVYVNEDGIKNLAVFSPDQIRSRFAAFDPWRKTAATAALYGVAAPDLLAQEAQNPDTEPGFAEGGLVGSNIYNSDAMQNPREAYRFADGGNAGDVYQYAEGGEVFGYQAGGVVKKAAKTLGEMVRKYTPETLMNEANQVAEEIKKMGPEFLPKVEQASGGSVYLTVSRAPLTKKGEVAKNRREQPIDFKARFADHPSYWGATISRDPITGNTPENILEMFKHKIGIGDLPSYSESFFNPADKYGRVTDIYQKEGVSNRGNPVLKTIREERPFTFYEPVKNIEQPVSGSAEDATGFAEGGLVANSHTADFDPARIDAIVDELHAMNAS